MQAILFGSAGFAGSARIMADCAAVMTALVDRVHVVTPSSAFHAGLMSSTVTRSTPGPILSDAIAEGGPLSSADNFLALALAEEIVSSAVDSDVILWAHYLFPYLEAGLSAKATLSRLGFNCRLWVTPAGSDIWQIRPQLPAVTTTLLSSGEIDALLTYSEGFAREVEQAASLPQGRVVVFTPCISDGPRRRSFEQYIHSRARLGIQEDALVMSNHSNMRPVKAVDDVIHLARGVARRRDKQASWLLLAGPPKTIDAPVHPLKLMHLGLIGDVSSILDPSDVEINLSRHDSFNMSIAEAMSAGVPTVTTRVAGVAQHVARAQSGLVVELETDSQPDQRYATARNWICRLGSTETESRFQLGQRGAAYAAAHFSKEQLADQLAYLVRFG